jgi:hypothetical protein
MTTKRIAAAIGIATALAAGTGTAHADTGSSSVYGWKGDRSGTAFAHELADDDYYLTDDGAYQLGFQACNDISAHEATEASYEQHLIQDLGYTVSIAVDIGFGATYHFCPKLHGSGYENQPGGQEAPPSPPPPQLDYAT